MLRTTDEKRVGDEKGWAPALRVTLRRIFSGFGCKKLRICLRTKPKIFLLAQPLEQGS